LFQTLSEEDKVSRAAFCENFITLFKEDKTPVSYLISSDKATFHLHEIINKQNVFIWGSENPDASVEFMLHYGPFFFTEHTVTAITCLDILELWLCCQLKEDFPGYLLFCQDREPPDYHLDVTVTSKYLNYATISKDLLSDSKL
jgi:hypothetical protein